MDEVLEKFSALIKDDTPNNDAGTNFEGLYKNWGRLDNQEQRRKEILSSQKTNRNTLTDTFRGIFDGVDNTAKESQIFKGKKANYRPQIYVAGFNKCPYNNTLMLSEWMVERPEDFHENWFVVPCPKGVRTLVIANDGTTQCYNKYGQFKFECKTALPGGSPATISRRRCCILDCFYVESMKTMYVLDLLAWNCQPMTDGETEFRHYWLLSNLDDIPDLGTYSKKNQLIFKILPKTTCDPQSFNEFMMSFPPFPNYTPALDGLLFYHKQAHYVAGQTPLVTWLYPFMVPEVLGKEITVNPGYMLTMPVNYVNQADYILKFTEKTAKSYRRKNGRSESMDTTPPVVVTNNEIDQNKQMATETGPQNIGPHNWATDDIKNDDKKDTKSIEQME
uniref:Snurportin-1 n=1 Tax=Heliothis virescens TaxID=7102 RepID=A0A2A4K620_HELVI